MKVNTLLQLCTVQTAHPNDDGVTAEEYLLDG